jgi:hypothetical protein
MKYLLLCCALLIAFASQSQSLKALDEKNGFRTLHFGDGIAALPNAKLTETGKNGVKYYQRTDENLHIGTANLKKITYGFYKGKFFFVLIQTPGLTDSRALRAALESQYGKGYQSNEYIEEYYWFGEAVTMSYDENSINGSAKIIITSISISKEEEEDGKAAAKKAASDL